MESLHKQRKEKYCEIASLIKPIIEQRGGVFIKLFNYNENESPSDVDIFVSPNNALQILKDFAKTFNAKFIKKRRFHSSSIEVVLPSDINSELHLDLYLEFVFVPSHIVTSINRTIYAKIPWCEASIKVPAPSQGFHAFFIMWHALRHRRFLSRDIRTLIEMFNSFSHSDLIEFLLWIQKSNLELEYIEMLYTLLLYSMMRKKVDQRALSVIIVMLRYLRSHLRKRTVLYHYIVARYKISEETEVYDLKLLNALKTLRDISRVNKIKDLYFLLRFVLTLFIYEYVITLLIILGFV